ncbi:MAG: pentapeptide repeat-containing protein [Alphaproteobacteria bacterium]|nr:pentapeptide repeat-containing protein [Alphaproteobacteria bacterium]MDA8004313.1 pentapeptide repeat-containing protein [Alphaproteobacteria bacterium]MDA8005248.1 pentapeptide repeat-containing protein [Alphaproteobacteria bacterium]MDA8013565.1 pentapeptide repeat-containing protein [Alphaproteobacteria bacterium]
MSNQQRGWREGKWKREWPLFWGVGLLASIILFHVFSFWAYQPYKGMPLGMYWLGRSVVIVLLAGLAVVVSVRYGQRFTEELKTCWRKLKVSLWRLERWCGRSPWKVGFTVFSIGLVAWMSLRPIFGVPPEVFWTGLVLIMLAGPTAGFTYWRGKQTNRQIGETQRQIKESRRQARFQSFDSIIQMAVDDKNSVRALAGWQRIHMWFSHEQGGLGESGDRRDKEDWENFLEIARDTAVSVLKVKPRLERVFRQDSREFSKKGANDPELMLWEDMQDDYFGETEKERIYENVRQQALAFLTLHPPREWKALSKLDMSRYDLSGLHLNRVMLNQRGLERGWEVTASYGHCGGMYVAPHTNLSGAMFSKAKMMGSTLSQTYLYRTNFEGSDLRYAQFVGAKMRDASLQNADLRGTDMRGADLSGAALKGVKMASRETGCHVYDFPRFHRTRIDMANFSKIENILTGKPVPAEELEDLLKGCWWDKSRRFNRPVLPYGMDANSICGSPEETRETGGRNWIPPCRRR